MYANITKVGTGRTVCAECGSPMTGDDMVPDGAEYCVACRRVEEETEGDDTAR